MPNPSGHQEGWAVRRHLVNQFLVAGCIAVAVAFLVPAAGVAQEAEEPEGPEESQEPFADEITVTAQKREQTLIEVPISIGLVDGATLELENRNEMTELQYLTPGLTFAQANTPRGEGNILRGVGTISFSDALEGSVGIVVDGVVLGRQGMGLQDLADVERVEVLRGPQGTLFGKNASAGVISVVTRPPARQLTGSFRFSFASLNEIKLSGSLGGSPGSDRLAARLSFYTNQRDGIVEDIAQNLEYNGRNEAGARGKLLIDASPRVSLLLAADYAERDDPCCIWTTRSTTPDGVIGPAQKPVVASPENLQVTLSGDILAEQSFAGGLVEINAIFGDKLLTSLSAFRKWDEFDNNDADQTTDNIMDLNAGDQAQRQFTQEVRLAGIAAGEVDWVAGFFYFGEDLDHREAVGGTLLAPLPPGLLLGNETFRDIRTHNYALFGDVTWSVNDRLQLFGGLRGIAEDKSMLFVRSDLPGHLSTGLGGAPPIQLESEIDDVDWSGRLGLQYSFSPRSNGYFKLVRGYKGGGFNTITWINSVEILEPEIPTGLEIGYKTQSRLFWLTVATFATRFKDFQAQSYDVETGGFILTNAGELETRGVEVAVQARPTQRVFLSGYTTYMDASFREFPGAPCYLGQTVEEGCNPITETQDLAGAPLSNAPDWTLNLATRYSFALGDLPFDGFVRGSYYWRDGVIFNLDQDPGTRHDSYGIANLALGVLSKTGRYEVSLFAKNLFDQHFVGLIFPLPFDPGGYSQFPTINAQRTVGVALNIDF